MDDPRRKLVADGYDELTEPYLAWSARVVGDPRERFLAELERRLDAGATVLDLGCGAGVPSTELLARRFDVVGVDTSRAQLRLARANVPAARFVQADMTALQLPGESFDGITAVYSISHVPRDEHGLLFRRIAGWLRPGGVFVASLGSGAVPDSTAEWLGVPMFFSSHDAETNRRLLREAGFELLVDEVVEMQEREGPTAFLWVVAVKA